MNGTEANITNYSDLVGFVPQDDIMPRDLSVIENLRFYARLRLPRTTTTAHCDAVAEAVTEALGLSHIKDSLIGDETVRGISGGQRKRVNGMAD